MPAEHRPSPALLHGDVTLSYAELAATASQMMKRWRSVAGLRVGLIMEEPSAYLPAVTALDALRCHVYLAGQRTPEAIAALADELRWNAIVQSPEGPPVTRTGPAANQDSDTGLVTLLTSGTTGGPKAANHSWETLAAPVRRDPRYAASRWLCAYPLNLYAGTQVMLQALLNWATLVVPPARDPETVARTLRDQRVTHAGGTPTFWRQLLLFAPREVLAGCSLEQITMGGEAATQGLLDQLTRIFPRTRLVHIYASTELGRLFTVTDRREGFPAAYLDEPPEAAVALKIEDGELLARSGNAMLGYDGRPNVSAARADGWVATGDLVERRGERILFRGRKSDVINVGGRKVLPAVVEAALREVPGVADVRVYARGSSLAGQLVAADVVIATGHARDAVLTELNRLARERLSQPEVPRLVRVVDMIAHSKALKVSRTEER